MIRRTPVTDCRRRVRAAEKTLQKMASNATSDFTNSTETPLSSHPCPFMADWAWRCEFLTPTTSKVLVALISLGVPIALFTILLNAMVIWAVWRKRYLRKQKPCVLLACLAATDLLVGAVVLPLFITGHALRLSGAPVCLVDTATWASMYIACGASLYHLVIVSGERYVAIKHALRYETLVRTRRITMAVATAWAVPVFTTSVEAGSTGPLEILLYVLVMFILLPGALALICFYQGAVFLESRRHRRHILAHQVSETAAKEILKEDKAARTVTMVVGALQLLCYASSSVYAGIVLTISDSLPKSVIAISSYPPEFLVCCNSLINPVIYCLRTRDFQRALRELFNLKRPQATPRQEPAGAINMTLRSGQGNCKPRVESPAHGERRRKNHQEFKRVRARSLDMSPDPSRRLGTRRNNSI